VDTGPLVALLNRRDRHNAWVREILDVIEPPVFTCEAVMSEACFLLTKVTGGPESVLQLVSEDVLRIAFRLGPEIEAVRALMSKFASVPMSLADACLVRMTELDQHSTVLTLDAHFKVYRRNKRQVVPSLMPSGRTGG
jgi:predicted nucleic acid-binding protein